jgi:hypothetical protein
MDPDHPSQKVCIRHGSVAKQSARNRVRTLVAVAFWGLSDELDRMAGADKL